MNEAPTWTPRMDERLRRDWGRVSAHDLAAAFGCTHGQVRNRASRLGLPFGRTEDGVYVHERDGPDPVVQDERFTTAMMLAIRTGRETAPIGIERRPSTKAPRYIPHRKNEPRLTSPAASCAEAGE